MKRLILFSMILSGVCSDCAVALNLTPAQRAELYGQRRQAAQQAAKAQIANLKAELKAVQDELQTLKKDAVHAIETFNNNFAQHDRELNKLTGHQYKPENMFSRMSNAITNVLQSSARNTKDQHTELVPAGSQEVVLQEYTATPNNALVPYQQQQQKSTTKKALEVTTNVLITMRNAAGSALGATLDGLNGAKYDEDDNLPKKLGNTLGTATRSAGIAIYNAVKFGAAKASEQYKKHKEESERQKAEAEAAAEAAAVEAAKQTPLKRQYRNSAKRKRADEATPIKKEKEEEKTSPPQLKRAKIEPSVGAELKFEDTDVAQKWENVIQANSKDINLHITKLIDTIPDMSASDQSTLKEIALNYLRPKNVRQYKKTAINELLTALLMAD